MKTSFLSLLVTAVSIAASAAGQDVVSAASRTVYTRNADGRIETVTTSEGTTRYSYFPDGEIREAARSDGSRDSYDQDERIVTRRLIARLNADASVTSSIPAGVRPRRFRRLA